ncbi:MAG: hypothetical protein IT292_05120 [Deltaproteobacteria bacterium]|nr:hypothetical protein [Deltaproteobacteria bacterium]
MRRIIIADSTLRGLEQNPELAISRRARLVIAQSLKQLNVDVLEIGYPAASVDEYRAVQYIATYLFDITLSVLARPNKLEIDRAWDVIRATAKPRLLLFMGSQATHKSGTTRLSNEEIMLNLGQMTAYAAHLCPDVQVSLEPIELCGFEAMLRFAHIAIDAGAKVINIPDTYGYVQPSEFRHLLIRLSNELMDKLKNNCAVLSVQCHNDLGNALANTLSALRVGVMQVECSIAGFGSAAGLL